MKLSTTLGEIQRKLRGQDWEKFCDAFGYDYYCCNEGGDHLQVYLDVEDAKRYNIV